MNELISALYSGTYPVLDSVNSELWNIFFILEMSHTFNQTTNGKYNTPVQNTGQMDLSVNNSRRSGDNISIVGHVGMIGSVGGQDVRNNLSVLTAGVYPTPTPGISMYIFQCGFYYMWCSEIWSSTETRGRKYPLKNVYYFISWLWQLVFRSWEEFRAIQRKVWISTIPTDRKSPRW